MRALDLFCGAGGVSMGLHRAGFHVTGVDIKPQPHYPFAFIQADALEVSLDGYDFIWASPPCQAHSWAARRWRDVPRVNLIPQTRERLIQATSPWAMENVPGAPLRKDLVLCGCSFGLNVIRHRHFECSFPVMGVAHVRHLPPILRGTIRKSAYACVAGHGGEGHTYRLADWRSAMGIEWMTKEELTEAIPPAYSRFIGQQAIQFIQRTAEAKGIERLEEALKESEER